MKEDSDKPGITAYHGSPHEFEQFDTSKIGTGEGAQAYGHGLYFAENEPIAKYYRDALSKPTFEYENKNYGVSKDFGSSARARILDEIKSIGKEKVLQQLKESISFNKKYAPLMSESKKDDLNWAKNIDPDKIVQKNLGNMYEVNIDAHPDHFLDWDNPLSEQSHHIIKSLIEHRKENPTMWEKIKPHLNSNETAGTIYQNLAAGHPHGYRGASEWLQRAGIQGIKYLDAGSRGTDSGSRNYVVFDHNRVKVKRRYEQGGRIKRATGGRIPHIDKAFKIAKKELDGITKPILNVHDDDIVKALRVLQGKI